MRGWQRWRQKTGRRPGHRRQEKSVPSKKGERKTEREVPTPPGGVEFLYTSGVRRLTGVAGRGPEDRVQMRPHRSPFMKFSCEERWSRGWKGA